MTEAAKPPVPATPESAAAPKMRRERRWLRIGFWTTVLLAAAFVGLCFWASSAGFENLARKRLVQRLESATGGQVEIAHFHWQFSDLEAEAGGVVIHGLESRSELPYAQVELVRARLSILGLWSPRIHLRDLELRRPILHLIVYADGTTNQPQPKMPRRPGVSTLDALFDLKATHASVSLGELHMEVRQPASGIRTVLVPFRFDANDFSIRVASFPLPGSSLGGIGYRIEAGARDLALSDALRQSPAAAPAAQPVKGYAQASIDLTRNRAVLSFLRITARSSGARDRVVEAAGELDDFAHPRWQARVRGEVDLQVLESVTGDPTMPKGIAHLSLDGGGQAGQFRIDGPLHIDKCTYIDDSVTATDVDLDAHVHADAEQLLISSITARLSQGGQLQANVAFDHWLSPLPGAAVLRATPPASAKTGSKAQGVTISRVRAPSLLAANVRVTANLSDVAVDTILDMVGHGPFQHLGLDARVNGPASAAWHSSDDHTLAVSAAFTLSPSSYPVPGEVPASGFVDATYTHSDGAVDVRRLDLRLPSSTLLAHGHLGAHPLASPSALTVELHSRNLFEFDTVLRDLRLSRNGKSGAAALPIALAGQADFLGTWTGSLVDPRIAGSAKATRLAIEVPPLSVSSRPASTNWDTVEGTGSYSSDRIELSHGLLRRADTEIVVTGSLLAGLVAASVGNAPEHSFAANAQLHLRLHTTHLPVDDVFRVVAWQLPVTGHLNAQAELDGPIQALAGSGWFELDNGTVFGEPVARARAQGSISHQQLRLSSVTVSEGAGRVSATGSYGLDTRRFQVDAKAEGVDLARVEWLRRKGLQATGKLGFSVVGAGTPDDPKLDIHASVTGVSLQGEPLGALDLAARTADHAATYTLTSHMEAAQIFLRGQTQLTGKYQTQADLDFSRFNVGPLFRMAHIEGLTAASALAGSAILEGPLGKPEEMRGQMSLQELAFSVSGVQMHSQGGARARLANSRITLEPLHITGEETDLNAQGSLSLIGAQQLDLAASGTVNLKVMEILDPDVTAGGATTFQVEAQGPLQNPTLKGQVDFQNGSLALGDMPNGLSQLRGALEFNQDRLEVRSLTAMSGGGLISLSGYLAYRHGIYADLTAIGKGIRIRYPEGISSLADGTLRLQGMQSNMLLSGNVLITRFAANPELDIAALAAQAAVHTVAPPNAPSNHIRLDVHLTSLPQLNFQNAYAKLAGDVDLRLRGTFASPSLLGRVSIAEGNATIAGTRYELQRGEINFTNPVRIAPTIDLSATAHVEDYDINLGVHGTPPKLNVSYRSDPPLPEADVVALLALGRTESQERLYTQQQMQTGANPTTDALLGGALNATVSSRVRKLFGAGSVKVDPNYLGALGNSTSRIIVEEQLGRNVTLTYATNVNTTGQQLIQAEIAINRHVSLMVARDESGVFSMVIKATRRYR